MEVGKLNVQYRSRSGSSVSRKLRQKGQIPAVCYGMDQEPVMLALDPTALTKALDPVKARNTMIELTVDGAPGGQTRFTAMLRDWQRDALRGDFTHADFVRVDPTQPVRVSVPLTLVGKAEGVKLGGIMHQVFRQLPVACTPDKIPGLIEVNVDHLGMGEALHVANLTLPPGVRPLLDGGLTICTVTAPRAEKAAVTEAAEGAVEGAPAAEAAKPGEAAKAAPAKAGEKAPAEKKEKK